MPMMTSRSGNESVGRSIHQITQKLKMLDRVLLAGRSWISFEWMAMSKASSFLVYCTGLRKSARIPFKMSTRSGVSRSPADVTKSSVFETTSEFSNAVPLPSR